MASCGGITHPQDADSLSDVRGRLRRAVTLVSVQQFLQAIERLPDLTDPGQQVAVCDLIRTAGAGLT